LLASTGINGEARQQCYQFQWHKLPASGGSWRRLDGPLPNMHPLMVIKGMDSSLIPVFEEIQKDGVARRVLEEEGALSWSIHMRFGGLD